jgi:hypothetical protein
MVHILKWKFRDVTLFLYIILIVPSSMYTHRRRWQQVFLVDIKLPQDVGQPL